MGYVLLTAVPVLAPASGGWTQAVEQMGTSKELYAFAAAGGLLGKAGVAVVGLTLVGLIFTNLVGNMFAASRLLSAMADDGVLPAWFGGKGAGDIGIPERTFRDRLKKVKIFFHAGK